MRPTFVNTQHGRLPLKSILNFALYNSDPGKYWTIVITIINGGAFRIFSLPGSMELIRQTIGIDKEIAFHDIILRDPNTQHRPLLLSLAKKLRLGQTPTDLELHALGDGILGEGVDHSELVDPTLSVDETDDSSEE